MSFTGMSQLIISPHVPSLSRTSSIPLEDKVQQVSQLLGAAYSPNMTPEENVVHALNMGTFPLDRSVVFEDFEFVMGSHDIVIPPEIELVNCRVTREALVSTKFYFTNGEVTAEKAGVILVAIGRGARAYAKRGSIANAQADGAESYAMEEEALAKASAQGAIAYAMVKDSIAKAEANGAKAIANALQAIAQALEQGSVAAAVAFGAEAFASGKGTKAYAEVSGSKAYATSPESEAYAHEKNAIAYATVDNAHAYATAPQAKVYATHEGAQVSISHPDARAFPYKKEPVAEGFAEASKAAFQAKKVSYKANRSDGNK